MLHGTSVMNLCSARFLRQRQEIRDDLRDKLDGIRRSADPLTGEDAERPFMIPRGHDPFDIWYKILEFVTGPEEIMALWEAHPLFREILRSNKAKYIQARFPEIVQILVVERYDLLLDHNGRGIPILDIFRLQKIFPLRLRLISKICKQSEEALLQTADHDPGWEKLYLIIQYNDQVRGMINDIRTKGFKNCFIPPHVKVDTLWLSGLLKAAFLESVRTFLELVGKQVKTFSCKIRNVDRPQEVHQALSEWVLQMPNLENLELYSEYYSWKQRQMQAVLPTFEELPAFPYCPKLRSFRLSRMMPKPFLQRILNGGPNMKILSPSIYCGSDELELPEPCEVNSTLKHLECLRIPLCNSLVSYLEFQLPLKEIIFKSSSLTSKSFSFRELSPFLHQFRGTLERLDLQSIWVDMSDKLYLDLPHLKSFKWLHNSTFEDLQFLLYAEHLEELEMLVEEMVEEDTTVEEEDTTVEEEDITVEEEDITVEEEEDITVEEEEEDIADIDSFSDRVWMEVTNGFDGLSLWDVFPRLEMFVMYFSTEDTYRELYRQ